MDSLDLCLWVVFDQWGVQVRNCKKRMRWRILSSSLPEDLPQAGYILLWKVPSSFGFLGTVPLPCPFWTKGQGLIPEVTPASFFMVPPHFKHIFVNGLFIKHSSNDPLWVSPAGALTESPGEIKTGSLVPEILENWGGMSIDQGRTVTQPWKWQGKQEEIRCENNLLQ